jgi:hypothetical protein
MQRAEIGGGFLHKALAIADEEEHELRIVHQYVQYLCGGNM